MYTFVIVQSCVLDYRPSGAEVEDRVFNVLKERLPLVASQPASTSGEMSVYIQLLHAEVCLLFPSSVDIHFLILRPLRINFVCLN